MNQERASSDQEFDRLARELCAGCMEARGGDVCIHCGWDHGTPSGRLLQLEPGTVLKGQYLVGRVLGQGGFGITYLAFDRRHARKVALKEYFPRAVASRSPAQSRVIPVSERVRQDFEEGLERFMEEGRRISLFREHPCIVAVHESFPANGTGYLVMEYLDGVTLRDYLASKGQRLPWGFAVEIMNHVLDGLKEVHRKGLLHRDVSPDNIFLTRRRTVKLIDFGAARFSAGERSQNLSVILKPGFAPEEQYRQRGQQGPWTDIYAAAATLYRTITGATPPDSLERRSADTLVPPSALGIAVPAAAERALMRGLAVQARDRFSTAAAFQAALSADAARPAAPDLPTRRYSPPRPLRLPPWAIALGAVALVGAVLYARSGVFASNQGLIPGGDGVTGSSLTFQGRLFRVNYPRGWEVHTNPGEPNTVILTPPEAFLNLGAGQTYTTEGVEASYVTDAAKTIDLETFTNRLLDSFRRSNQDVRTLEQRSDPAGLVTEVTLRSVRGNLENDRIVTSARPDGFFVLILMAPADEYRSLLPRLQAIAGTVAFQNE